MEKNELDIKTERRWLMTKIIVGSILVFGVFLLILVYLGKDITPLNTFVGGLFSFGSIVITANYATTPKPNPHNITYKKPSGVKPDDEELI